MEYLIAPAALLVLAFVAVQIARGMSRHRRLFDRVVDRVEAELDRRQRPSAKCATCGAPADPTRAAGSHARATCTHCGSPLDAER